MKIDIIIPSHKNLSGIQKLIESCLTVDLTCVQNIYIVLNPENLEIERNLLKKFENQLSLRFIQTKDIGVNCARNLGVQNSTAEILLLLDDDEIITDTSLFKKHLARHMIEPELLALGGLYELAEPTSLWSRTYHRVQIDWLLFGERLDGMNYHLLGGHISFKRQVFEKHFFNPNIFFGGAETEFLFRLMQSKIICRLDAHLSILHSHRLSLISFLKKAYLQGRTHRKYSFQDTTSLHRKILQKKFTDESRRMTEKLARKIYFLAFNLGRNYVTRKQIPTFYVRNFLLSLRRQIFLLTLRLDFLAKKIDKTGPPNA